MPLVVTAVTSPELHEKAIALRFRVFVDEVGFDAADEIDEHDSRETTVHFLGKDAETGEFVAVARCLVDPVARTARIGRVAVLPGSRGKRFGVALLQGVEAHVKPQVQALGLSARYDRRSFYERLGYRCAGDETYVERGERHCWMVKPVAG